MPTSVWLLTIMQSTFGACFAECGICSAMWHGASRQARATIVLKTPMRTAIDAEEYLLRIKLGTAILSAMGSLPSIIHDVNKDKGRLSLLTLYQKGNTKADEACRADAI